VLLKAVAPASESREEHVKGFCGARASIAIEDGKREGNIQ